MSPILWLFVAIYGASLASGLRRADVTSGEECRARSLLLLPQDGGVVQPCDYNCQQQQRSALLIVFSTTNGPGWYNALGWGTAAHHCTWHGVICCNPSSTPPSDGLGGSSDVQHLRRSNTWAVRWYSHACASPAPP